MQHALSIQITTWHSNAQPTLIAIREAVFIDEQNVPITMEWDDEDDKATHLIAFHRNEAVACARIVQDSQTCKIGRMAVLKNWRGQGIGQYLLTAAISYCQQKTNTIKLSAQTQVIPFYEQAGFIVSSEPYLDANIWHADMVLTINEG